MQAEAFPALTGLTYLAASAAGRGCGTLWAPGSVVASVGLAAALWLPDGRMPDSFPFLAIAVIALGLGGVLAGLLAPLRGFSIGAERKDAVLLSGASALLEQQMVSPFAGRTPCFLRCLGCLRAAPRPQRLAHRSTTEPPRP